MTVYGYARVSTLGQGRDGNGLEVQERELKARGCEVIYAEAYTGTKEDRPRLSELIEKVTVGDTVMVTKLDRIARSTRAGISIIDRIVAKGAGIDILNMGKFDDSPVGKLMRTMMLGFAEFERDMIVQRTSEGKEIARQRADYREGRPEKYWEDEGSWQKTKERWGISKATYYRRIKDLQSTDGGTKHMNAPA